MSQQTISFPKHCMQACRLCFLAVCCLLSVACVGATQDAPAASTLVPEPPVPTATSSAVAQTPSSPTPLNTTPELSKPTPQDLTLSLELVATGLRKPLFLTHAGDGSERLFLLEQQGRIYIHKEGQLIPEPFLDIRDRVNDQGNEQGLLGLAFAPDYVKSLQFYVNYTAAAGQTRISRFTASSLNPDIAWPDSEEVILEVAQPRSNHNGGMIAFGPDNMLWIGMGDGGGGYDQFRTGQNPQSLLAKMVRIDVLDPGPGEYAVPADNPWVSESWQGEDMLPEVWAVGLRNPWRFSFDRDTGDLWIADVGQDRFEEIHFVPAPLTGGLNFGWPIREGKNCLYGADCQSEGLLEPVIEFSQETGVCSITGGYVYRGRRYPAAVGGYVAGDYCSGEIWMTFVPEDGSSNWSAIRLLDTAHNISSFGEDEKGELYLVAQEGQIYRMHFGES